MLAFTKSNTLCANFLVGNCVGAMGNGPVLQAAPWIGRWVDLALEWTMVSGLYGSPFINYNPPFD